MRAAGLIVCVVAIVVIWQKGAATPLGCTLLFTAGYLLGLTAKRRPE